MGAIRAFAGPDQTALIELWRRCDLLVNPLNDPAADIALCLESGHGEILVHEDDGALTASIMVGHDGHRGWIYYLATDPDSRRQGLGRRMVAAAEAWLKQRAMPKVELIVRETNTRAVGFYQRLGYTNEPRTIMSRRLDGKTVPAGGQTIDDPVVITYLEMTERPKLPVLPPRAKTLALMKAAEITVPFYRYVYDAVGRPWYWTDRKALADHELAEILDDPRVDVFVLYVSGVPAGYFELDGRTDGTIDLAYFGIMPEFIGRALGPYMLGQAIDIAWARDPAPGRMTVNTCTLDHRSALPMYQRLGFRPVRRQEVPAPWHRIEADAPP